ncbi:Reverse transcriptase (RNA-dependent DNA polymerase) [Phytophthora infestans]|uniref:Reverse transcriptase (RNA-dependent DNA polymerase) n=1 Tax=Phytophthora infestans TaxID=4787 RepID=A0A8S9U1U6_PHYIN|nr:Reverse transcriptase (RNA-dependent DNA polymerase) [Phytophthora infestans]
MSTETKSFMKNGTFKKVELPGGRSAIKSEWVLKKKSNADGSLNKYKARLVAKNFSQRYDEDYSETFSPVVRCSSLRLVLVVVVVKRVQIDVKLPFSAPTSTSRSI